MTTALLFRDDAYARDCEAEVLAITERGAIVLDRTVFYATGGGQPGDSGVLLRADGGSIPIAIAVYGEDKSTILHVPAEGGALPSPGERVTARIDWTIRYKRMRIHSALHVLTTVLPFPVTGGAIGDGEGRLDFDMPEAPDKDQVAAELAKRLATRAEIHARWISDEELEANPGLIKTMSVKPPMGSGRVRLIEIAGLDLQPCGGTHVRDTAEIGAVAVTGIEKKGKLNRRVRIALA